MEKKDFLDQFTDESKTKGNKPSSFNEEEMTKVVKEKKAIDPKWIILPILCLIAVGAIVYFIFFKANITMQNFVGFTKTDVANFVRQQGINADGIVFKEEFSLEFDQDQIISQDVEEGKKIGKDAKITFIVSKGADPDEYIEFPTNLKEMTKDQVEEWININKLSKTRITTVFDPVVEEGKVITYDLKNTDPKEFKRGSILQIKVSKGPQPPTQVTVEDFKGKDYGTAETWAKNKKIIINKVEEFSDTLAAGLIISQSSPVGSTISEGSNFTVVVSKGKGILVPNFSTMSNKDVDKWLTANASIVSVNEKYSSSSNYIIEQSVESGKMIGADDKLEVTKSLGNWYKFSNEFGMETAVGQTLDAMADKANSLRSKGIDSYFGEWSGSERQWSETYGKNVIVSFKCADSKGNAADCNGHLPLDTRFTVVCSRGKKIIFDDVTDFGKIEGSPVKYNTQKVVDALASKGIPFNLDTKTDTCEIIWNTQEKQETNKHIWYEGATTITLR